jgi:hypothetical protein
MYVEGYPGKIGTVHRPTLFLGTSTHSTSDCQAARRQSPSPFPSQRTDCTGLAERRRTPAETCDGTRNSISSKTWDSDLP